MFALLLTTIVLLALTVAMHAFGTVYWGRFLMRRYGGPDGNFHGRKALPALTWTAVFLLMLHLAEVIVWALAYLLVLPESQLDSFDKAVYFSVVTFTTLGYGDITLIDSEWRVLSGMEALNGILLVGWTTAFLFVIFQRSWRGLSQPHDA
jgi:voltage-gated potassium channel